MHVLINIIMIISIDAGQYPHGRYGTDTVHNLGVNWLHK